MAMAAFAMSLSLTGSVDGGAIPGPRTFNGYIDARYDKTDTYFIDFRGGQVASIRVNNMTNLGDIDLVVYDLDGRVVKSDRSRDDDAKVSFTPTRTSRFRVVVVGYAGERPLRYQLKTN
jgi:hypothetical protein